MSPPIGRRSFLGWVAALVGLPAALPGSVNGRSKRPPTPVPPAGAAAGRYYRSEDLHFQPKNADIVWQQQPRIPIWESSLGNEPLFIEAIERNEILYGTYQRWGDSTVRRITPIQLFEIEPEDENPQPIYQPAAPEEASPADPWQPRVYPTYLAAWDHDHQAPRTFLASQFAPFFTAPWMHTHAPGYTQREWEQVLQRTANELRQRGVPPVAGHAQFLYR